VPSDVVLGLPRVLDPTLQGRQLTDVLYFVVGCLILLQDKFQHFKGLSSWAVTPSLNLLKFMHRLCVVLIQVDLIRQKTGPFLFKAHFVLRLMDSAPKQHFLNRLVIIGVRVFVFFKGVSTLAHVQDYLGVIRVTSVFKSHLSSPGRFQPRLHLKQLLFLLRFALIIKLHPIDDARRD